MPILGSFASSAIGTVGLAQQAMLAFLKASTAISGSSFVLQQLVGGPDGSYIAGRNNSIPGQSSFAADGDYLVTGSGWTNEVLVWNLSDGSLHMTIPAPSPPPQTNGYGWQIDIHGDYFITGNGGTGGGYTTIHNVSTGALITSFTGAARNVAIDENYAVACASGGPIKIFELATSTLTTFQDPNGGLSDEMDISGNNLIIAPNNGSLITVHDIPTALSNGNLNTTSLTINTTVSYFQTLIAGGNYLALGRTSDVNKSIFVYDLTTGTLLHTLPAPVGASAAFGNAIDIKGNYLVAGHRGQEQYSPAAVYDLTTGILLQTFTGDDIPDTSTWLNPDIGRLLGTAVAITDSKTIIGSSSGGESSNNAGAFLIYSNPGQELQESTGPAEESTGWTIDLSNVTYVAEHNLTPPITANAFALTFSTDGTKLYVCGITQFPPRRDEVVQYSLSTAFDISTASYDNIKFNPSSQDTYPMGIAFNTDGTKMFLVGSGTHVVFQYSLSTPWDIGTASYDNLSISAGGAFGIHFNADGTKMYTIGYGSEVAGVRSFSLSTGFDLSTATDDLTSYSSIAVTGGNPFAAALNPDGTKMYILGYSNKSIYRYSLSTAFDVSTATYDNESISLDTELNTTYNMEISRDGTKIYVVGDTGSSISVLQFDTGL